MRILLALAGLLAACQPAPPPPDLVVDHCALEEYRQECELEVSWQEGTPAELAACIQKAHREAMRIRAGVPAPCLTPRE